MWASASAWALMLLFGQVQAAEISLQGERAEQVSLNSGGFLAATEEVALRFGEGSARSGSGAEPSERALSGETVLDNRDVRSENAGSGPLNPAYAEAYADGPSRTQVLKRGFGAVPGELRALVSYPRDHWQATRNGLLAVGALVLLDRPLTRAWQSRVEPALDGFRLPRSPLDSTLRVSAEDGWLLTAVGATGLWGLATDDSHATDVAFKAGRAAVYSVLVSQLVLKSLTGRYRPPRNFDGGVVEPGESTNPYDFGHLHFPRLGSGGVGSGMPSYHFTVFAAVATVYAEEYQKPWLAYGLAGMGLASNVRGHHHWVSDMAAGVLIGHAIGKVVSASPKQSNSRFSVVPMLNEGGAGIGVRYVF